MRNIGPNIAPHNQHSIPLTSLIPEAMIVWIQLPAQWSISNIFIFNNILSKDE